MGYEMWEFLEESRKDFGENCVSHSNFLAYDASAELIMEEYDDTCYSEIFYDGNEIEKLFIGFGETTGENHRAWNNWVINESMFADVFITKNSQEGEELGFEVDTSKELGFVAAGMIVLRTPYEKGFEFIEALQEFGFTNVEVLALIHNVDWCTESLALTVYNCGHKAFPIKCPFHCFEEMKVPESGKTLKGGGILECGSIHSSLSRGVLLNIEEKNMNLDVKSIRTNTFTNRDYPIYSFNKNNLTKVLDKLKGKD